jgi:hypothetical protein
MSFQMRQGTRKSIDRAAWINLGDGLPLRQCTLVDVSDFGARLSFADDDDIPNTFSLLLTRFGQPTCDCKVVWRRSNAVGVQFVR